MEANRVDRLGDWLWFLAWALLSTAGCWYTAWHTGATWDEPIHLRDGLEAWRTFSHRELLRLGAMPLAIDLYTLPLYLWETARGQPFDLDRDLEALLPWFRLGALGFWWLLLLYGRLLGRWLAGPWAGRLAVALLAIEPTLLAHASLAGTDIAVTACLVALVYHFRAGREAGWFRRLALPTFWFAAAVLAKASGLVLGGIAMVVLELDRLIRQGAITWPTGPWFAWCGKQEGDSPASTGGGSLRDWLRTSWQALGPLRRDVAVIVGIGMVLVFVYCGCDWQAEPSWIAWARQLPPGPGRSAMVWLAENLCIFRNAGEAIVRQVTHNMRGHGVYLLGQSDRRWFWYYFPVALTMKLSLPLLFLPLALALVRWRALTNAALVLSAVLLLATVNCHVQIGVRLVMPLIVILTIGLATALVQGYRQARGARRRFLLAAAAAGVAWTATATAVLCPHWLCHHNELWGGSSRGYLCLSDSNYDWGQGLPELERWHRQNHRPRLALWYFGTDPAIARLPFRPVQVRDVHTPEQLRRLVRSRYLAVGATLVYGSYDALPQGQPSRWAAHYLRTCTPIARTSTFFIYDLGREP